MVDFMVSGSASLILLRLFEQFPTAPNIAFNLTSHHNVTRRIILQRHALINGLELVVGTVQVLFLPSGCFHLSLTVLVHYRSHREYLGWEMVLPDSDRISRPAITQDAARIYLNTGLLYI